MRRDPEFPLDPPEPEYAGTCAACAEEITAGSLVYQTAEGPIHTDCLRDYLSAWSRQQLAEALGYRETILCSH